MRHLKTLLTVLGAVTVLVLATNTIALATTGHAFILGRSNTANKVTTLSRTTSGSALSLHTTSSAAAPLTVNGHGKVAHLNADLVDGYDGSQTLNKSLVFERSIDVSTPASGFTVTLTHVPAGKYLFNSSGLIHTPTTDAHVCVLTVPSTSRQFPEWFPADTSGAFITPSGTGFVTVPTTQDLTYRCYDNASASNTWFTSASQPLQLVLTPVAVQSTGATTIARSVAPRRVPAH